MRDGSTAIPLLRRRRFATTGGYVPPTAADLLGTELSGFSLDFLLNSYAVRTVTSAELIALQLGNEWNGLALDFTTNLYLNQITSSQAEQLLGTGPDTQEPSALGVDFTDNSLALRN